MSRDRYFVYILASKSRRLYIGVTNDLERRVFEHKQHLVDGFTKQYRIDRLVYFEETSDVMSAIAREKEIKGWLREKKVALIESANPTWEDLTEAWYKADSNTKADSSLRSE
jgi:putative endonuclease